MTATANNEESKSAQQELAGFASLENASAKSQKACTKISTDFDGVLRRAICSESLLQQYPGAVAHKPRKTGRNPKMKTAVQTQPAKTTKPAVNPSTPIPHLEPEVEDTTPEAPQIVEIPENEEFFVGSSKPSAARINGLYPVTVVGLKHKPASGQKGQGARMIFTLALESKQEDGTPNTCEYDCSSTWKTDSQLQIAVGTVLGRTLTAAETQGQFNINILRGQRCVAYVTEHRTRPKNGSTSTRSLVVGHLQPVTTKVEAGAVENAEQA